jgi:hypothetical protein
MLTIPRWFMRWLDRLKSTLLNILSRRQKRQPKGKSPLKDNKGFERWQDAERRERVRGTRRPWLLQHGYRVIGEHGEIKRRW